MKLFRWLASLGSRSEYQEFEAEDYACNESESDEHDSVLEQEQSGSDDLPESKDLSSPEGQGTEGLAGTIASIDDASLSSDDESKAGSNSLAVPESGFIWEPSSGDIIYSAFDASQPANLPVDLRGRDKELRRLLSAVLYRRNHAVVAGLRGSGKTSLLRVFGHLADQEGVVALYTSCAEDTTFGALFRELLEQIPYSCIDPEKADLFEHRIDAFGSDSTPLQVVTIASMIEYSQVILIIDEFDRIELADPRADIATTLKLLSDRRLPVRVILAGDEDSFAEIIDNHPSLRRHVTQISTKPLEPEAISSVLDLCASRSGMQFADPAKELLVRISAGSPYHARLFGMHSATVAAERKSTTVTERDVFEGFGKSFEEWASINQEDAVAFRSIVAGWHGDPERFIDFTKMIVETSTGETTDASGATTMSDGENEKAEELSAFGPAISQSKDRIAFRDATAPQFLMALRSLAQEQQRRSRSNEGSDVRYS